MPEIDPATAAELTALSTTYALAADERDAPGFCGAFTDDGVLEVDDGSGRPPSVLRGHDELCTVPARLARFDRTFHHVGQGRYEADGEEATGVVPCTAHHLSVGEPTTDRTMQIRYRDRYRRTVDGWRIAHRRVVVGWTATTVVDLDD